MHGNAHGNRPRLLAVALVLSSAVLLATFHAREPRPELATSGEPARPAQVRPPERARGAYADAGARSWSVPPSGSLHGSWPAVEPVEIGGAEVAARELLVRPRPRQGDALDERLVHELGAIAIAPLPFLDVRRVLLPEGVSLEAARELVAGLDEVEEAGFNAIARGAWHGRGASVGRHADWSWDATGLRPGGRGATARLVVAVVDSGVADSPGLARVERVAPFDAIDGDDVPQDENGHGTFLANLLVGSPGLGGPASLMPIRALDRDLVGTEASLVAGIHHATMNGADVINLSLVFGPDYLPTRLLDAAIADALSLGTVIVGAAGNDGRPFVRYPAAFPGVIAVGASTPDGARRLARAPYSSFGPALDVLAPGGDVDSDENRDGMPDGIVAESIDPATGRFGLWLYAGTSQAAAHATATALRLLADGVAPERVPHQLRERAREASLPYERGFDLESGAGHLWLAGAARVGTDAPVIGVELIAVLYDRPDGRRAVGTVVLAVDPEGLPVANARIHARVARALSMNDACTTGALGTCILEGGPLERSGEPVVVEAQAAVLDDGRVARPRTVASHAATSAALAAVDGTGFGPSSVLWLVEPSFGSLYFPSASSTWLLFGSGDGSALPPTLVALDDASARLLLGADGTSGTGFGPSSVDWYALRFVSWYSLSSWIGGTGFGPSSIDWGGWTFVFWGRTAMTWGMSAGGSPLHELTGAAVSSALATTGGP